MSIENFIEKFSVSADDDGSLIRLMYYRAITAIGDSTKRGDCWVYPTTNDSGYGIIKIAGKAVAVSRLILCCASHMPLNHKMDACHISPICRFKACCNPEHLYWDTHKSNCERREAERRGRQAAEVLVGNMMGSTTALSPSGKDLPS
jgi:hypothetical protein